MCVCVYIYIYCNAVKFYFQYNSPSVLSALDFLSLHISGNLNGVTRSGGVFQVQTTLNLTKPSGNNVCRKVCLCVRLIILRNADVTTKNMNQVVFVIDTACLQ